ncbi:uncharacterized protein LOC120418926 isoform X4 [Culex pipiens pallens]|uniref:uncharacterized protein LOC120418926 isoform X4 n=1 Tax=Culex pipiens pallens TaxID=42434 RepID=UPI00195370CC|nr:uncharacterized protein LOC120418926 isoform X4 [Culex pipiens pallens]
MGRFRFLKVAKLLLMCNIEYDSERGQMVQTGTLPSLVVVAVYFCFVLYYVTQVPHNTSSSFVENFSVVGRVLVTYLTIMLVVVEHFFRRKRMLKLGKLMLAYVEYRRSLFKEIPTTADIGKLAIRVQICTIVGLPAFYFVMQIVRYFRYINFVHVALTFASLIPDAYMLGNLIFVQMFNNFVCREMKQLTRRLLAMPIRPLVHGFDQLIVIKRCLDVTLGVRLLLTLFQLTVNVSIYSYLALLYMFERRGNFVFEIVQSLATIVINNTLVLLGVTYSFDRIQSEEQEFKNAIKSLQYEATEEHSEDYLNFLDLINLKLMTESPKITACGLFTVNLQVFYNVFAAIVTYIMILFQFRDFEK